MSSFTSVAGSTAHALDEHEEEQGKRRKENTVGPWDVFLWSMFAVALVFDVFIIYALFAS